MSAVNSLVKRHPLVTYFALAFAISWGGVLIVTGPGGIPATPEQVAAQSPFVYVAMLAGTTVAGILLTGLVSGRAGFRELLSRLAKWRVGNRWYVVALLATPLLALGTLLALSPFSPVFLPGIMAADEKGSVLLTGIVMGLVVGFFEELGWTGYATPRLRLRYGLFATGLIVGLLWGAWHFILAFWASGNSYGELLLSSFMPWLLYNVGVLPVYRLLMVWVYDHTESLLVAMLMHASLTGGLALILMPQALSGLPNLIWYFVLTAALWAFVAAIAITNGGRLSPQRLRGRAA